MANKPIYTNQNIIELLKRLPLFSVFAPEELRRLLYSGKFIRIEKFKPNEVIIGEGTFGKWVYIIINGKVKVVAQGAEITTLSKQGEVLGEIGAIKNQIRTASVVAVNDTVCIAINISVIEHLGGKEKAEYLKRINDFFSPIIEDRLQTNEEVFDILSNIKKKEEEIKRLRARLRTLGVGEERSIIELILDDGS